MFLHFSALQKYLPWFIHFFNVIVIIAIIVTHSSSSSGALSAARRTNCGLFLHAFSTNPFIFALELVTFQVLAFCCLIK